MTPTVSCSPLCDVFDAQQKRIAELEAFVAAVRHAAQLFSDGYKVNGEIQLRESLAHLDRRQQG